jgi:hypothetical protein
MANEPTNDTTEAGPEPGAPPIRAWGQDLSAGTTHGVEELGMEDQGPAKGERSDAGAPAYGIGGATEGDPIAENPDHARPPTGSSPAPSAGPGRPADPSGY